jgi:glucuronoarabinoxylan endo-1,4-beta-xylanase
VSDAISLADVGIIANHNYVTNNTVGDTNTPAVVNNYGKALWQTEVSLLSGSDSSIANGLYYAKRIHLFMTVAQVNAWHYWWLISGDGVGNQGLMDNNASTTKRLFAVGQYSRFVRPGYYRIDATNTGPALISAYKDTVAGTFAIVAVNTGSTTIGQTFTLTNFTAVTSVTPWITSATLNLASQTAVAVTNSVFTYTLPAQSIVTFVGQAAPNLSNEVSTIQVLGSNVLVTIPSVLGETYQLQYSDSMVPTNWLNVGSSTNGIAAPLTVIDPGGAVQPQRFYRFDITP